MANITVVGLGPGSPEHISQGAWRAISGAGTLYLRTAVHPTVQAIREAGVDFKTFDGLYSQAEDFDSLYDQIVGQLLDAARREPAVYAVPGHPLVAETSVTRLLNRAREEEIAVEVIPSMSCLEVVYAAVELDPTDGIGIYDALAFPARLDTGHFNLFTQVYSRFVAAELKLQLMNYYDDEHPVKVVQAAGVPGQEKVVEIPLWKLDTLAWVDHLTTIVVPPTGEPGPQQEEETLPSAAYPLDELVDIMAILRGETGCPWDRKQDHQSLKRYLIEEAYEVLEAIDADDPDLLVEELGDVLLQVVFHAQIARENGVFDIGDVISTVCAKLIRRHPHVFGDLEVENSEQVSVNWDKIKAEEKKGERQSALDGVPAQLPALMRAEKIQKKAAKVGFDWEDVKGALEKIPEEVAELTAARGNEKATEEFGDLLFALTNVARHLDIDPEAALRQSIEKFIRRFRAIEAAARQKGRSLKEMTLTEMDELWDQVKRDET